jgi:hypothetical protein
METDIQITPLPSNFTGRAEVKGFEFTKITSTKNGFIYKVESGPIPHYEVFKYKLTPICLDFVKRIYAENQFKEHYPKKNAFGVWAWTVLSYGRALEILKNLPDVDKPKA